MAKKAQELTRFYIRLNQADTKRLEQLRKELQAKSATDVFRHLVRTETAPLEAQEAMLYSILEDFSTTMVRRLRAVETLTQLQLSFFDTYVKYMLTAMPEIPTGLLSSARVRGKRLYEQINLSAARQFQRRREERVYENESLLTGDPASRHEDMTPSAETGDV
ncbi:hypothetical protein ACPOL_7230 (plasmid) [Acidisarcina polymorpha]|uniref:Uncharacterized protein n=1 Tax=Acidisarcina polymorpha TaxID=2211140 RepID=A0A2Z5GBX3_9BACT|nr:hypothetical protein [Acidisarcina polymorpha]AXC16420.1 hypothetical protein ACPOL_7230 [Acidisarcina polymorpha]